MSLCRYRTPRTLQTDNLLGKGQTGAVHARVTHTGVRTNTVNVNSDICPLNWLTLYSVNLLSRLFNTKIPLITLRNPSNDFLTTTQSPPVLIFSSLLFIWVCTPKHM